MIYSEWDDQKVISHKTISQKNQKIISQIIWPTIIQRGTEIGGEKMARRKRGDVSICVLKKSIFLLNLKQEAVMSLFAAPKSKRRGISRVTSLVSLWCAL